MHSLLQKAYKIVSEQKDFYELLVKFLQNKGIFAKGTQDFFGSKMPFKL